MVGRVRGAVGVLLPVALAVSCVGLLNQRRARVALEMTSRPGVVAAWVALGEIYLTEDGDDSGGESARIPLLSENAAGSLGLVDLTQLAETTLELADDVEVPEGTYAQMRIVLQGAVIETETGGVYTWNALHPLGKEATGSLQCPGCGATGIKVLMPGGVGDLETASRAFVLDFDVTQTFGRQVGASGTWVMNPVIRGAEVGFTGAVAGVVDVLREEGGAPLVTVPECPAGTPLGFAAFVVEATSQTLTDDLGQPLLATVVPDEAGDFAFPFLPADEYLFGFRAEVELEGGAMTFEAEAPGIATVSSGSYSPVEYTITAATCQEG